MFEKVNPSHPDKIADRIAGAIVDLAYKTVINPKIAVEVLIGHDECYIIAETSEHFDEKDIQAVVARITGRYDDKTKVLLMPSVYYTEVPQDVHLAENQSEKIRCGDNGIFRGMPITDEQRILSFVAHDIYKDYGSDGKYIFDMPSSRLIVCQSRAVGGVLKKRLLDAYMPYAEKVTVNPLGDWSGGINVDSGATNRKLGSDMGDAVTGGGLHGKDLSKADVSVNIYAHLKAQQTGKPVELYCAIGDEYVDGRPYSEIVEIAREYIRDVGGFEKFAEWGLI